MQRHKPFYRRNLPHIQPQGASFFITCVLYGSVSHTQIQQLKLEYEIQFSRLNLIQDLHERNKAKFVLRKRHLDNIDQLLHLQIDNPQHLANPIAAKIVTEQLRRFDGVYYNLICYSVMSNHFHFLIDTSTQFPADQLTLNDNDNYVDLDKIMKKIKGPIASYCNKALNLSGKFFQRESFDMYIRNEIMYKNVIAYILNNPVKSGICATWEEHPFTYCKTI